MALQFVDGHHGNSSRFTYDAGSDSGFLSFFSAVWSTWGPCHPGATPGHLWQIHPVSGHVCKSVCLIRPYSFFQEMQRRVKLQFAVWTLRTWSPKAAWELWWVAQRVISVVPMFQRYPDGLQTSHYNWWEKLSQMRYLVVTTVLAQYNQNFNMTESTKFDLPR